MKRKISDILDSQYVQDVALEGLTPLSSRRIKEITMKQVQKDYKPKRSIGFKVLMAAAVIASLTLTAFAAERVFGAGDWFRDVLNDQLRQDQAFVDGIDKDLSIRETVTQEQMDVISDMGKVFENVTKTDRGTSITLTAAYADEYVVHMYFQVEAPEGTVLPDGITYHFADVFGDSGYNYLINKDGSPIAGGFRSAKVEALPDSDPQDNRKDFQMTLTCDFDSKIRFNDGVPKFLHITGIYEQKVNADGDSDATVSLALCDVTFDITMENDPQQLELDMTDKEYSGTYVRIYQHPEGISCLNDCPPLNEDGTHTESWKYTVTPKKFIISPTSVEWATDYWTDNERVSMTLHYTIYMKDGTSPILTVNDGGLMDSGTEAWGMNFFTVPIDLEDIDYIIIGDPEFGESHRIDF